jgi:hypothetical protein
MSPTVLLGLKVTPYRDVSLGFYCRRIGTVFVAVIRMPVAIEFNSSIVHKLKISLNYDNWRAK